MYYLHEYADILLEHMWKPYLFACQRSSQENSCSNLFRESIHKDIKILGEWKIHQDINLSPDLVLHLFWGDSGLGQFIPASSWCE